jgi:hypothetical protein
MSYRDIRNAQQAVWPAIVASLDRHRASRLAIRRDPNPTVAAAARSRKPWDRVVAEETVWTLAKADLLCLPEQAAVVKAAKEWAASWMSLPPNPEVDEEADVALYAAVQALATAPANLPDENA